MIMGLEEREDWLGQVGRDARDLLLESFGPLV